MKNWAKSGAIAVSLFVSLGSSNAFAANNHPNDGHGHFGPFILSNFEAFCSKGGTGRAQYTFDHSHNVLELAASGPSSEGRVQITPVNGVVFNSIEVIESGDCGVLSSPASFEISIDYIPPGGTQTFSSFQCGVLRPNSRGNLRFLRVVPGTQAGNGNPIPEGSTLVDIFLALNTSNSNPIGVMHKALISGVTLNGSPVGFDMTVPSALCPGGR